MEIRERQERFSLGFLVPANDVCFETHDTPNATIIALFDMVKEINIPLLFTRQSY